MRVFSLIIDDFLLNPQEFREYAITRNYDGVRNPQDGVTYPDISIDIPNAIKQEILMKLSWWLTPIASNFHNGAEIDTKMMFMRMSKKGVHVPHQAHTDKNIADYTFLLYLNKDEDCQGGTEVLEHIDGMKSHPKNDEEILLWKRDHNIQDKWKVISNCPMKFNRAFVIDSHLFHRAQPIGGFGETNENSRLVLTCFFNLV